MRISKLSEGIIFAIEGNRTYPKLKLNRGYVDIRDEIYKDNPVDREVEIIKINELYEDFQERFGMDKDAVDNLIGKLTRNQNI